MWDDPRLLGTIAAKREKGRTMAPRPNWRLSGLALIPAVAVPVSSGCDSSAQSSPTSVASTTTAVSSTTEAVPTDMQDAGALAIDITGDWLAAGEGAVWLSNPPTGEVYRLDPDSGKTVETIRVPQEPSEAGDVGFGAFWTATCTKPGLARIDGGINEMQHVRLPVTTVHGAKESSEPARAASGSWSTRRSAQRARLPGWIRTRFASSHRCPLLQTRARCESARARSGS